MKTCVSALALILFFGGLVSRADTFHVVLDTSPLAGQSGYLAFDLVGGSPVQNNSVTISNFASNSTVGTLTLTGAASGSIVPGPGTLSDAQFFNELLQGVVFGTSSSFDIDLATNFAPAGIPDEFSFYLLDPLQDPFTTSDPTGADALLDFVLDGSPLQADVYTSQYADATVTSAPIAATPELGSIWLVGSGISLASLLLGRRHRACASVNQALDERLL